MKALFIVEPNFLFVHVGVRRVILYYTEIIRKSGMDVYFATPSAGKLFLGNYTKVKTENSKTKSSPYWSHGDKPDLHKESKHTDEVHHISWTDTIADSSNYNIVIITAPWVCYLGLPSIQGAIGIVYDLVPNLLACAAINFPNFINIYEFANHHNTGFTYYLSHASKILCISKSTKNDFVALYRTSNFQGNIISNIPYQLNKNTSIGRSNNKNLLLVNALDWRKNFLNIEKIIQAAAKKVSFNLYVVGQERIPLPTAIAFLEGAASLGLNVHWWREADDTTLLSLYRESSVLLFPSIYEGLGLPILEAQEHGIPVITSNTSSCSEINLNPELCFDPNDITGMTSSLVSILNGTHTHLSGIKLQEALHAFLKPQQMKGEDLHA